MDLPGDCVSNPEVARTDLSTPSYITKLTDHGATVVWAFGCVLDVLDATENPVRSIKGDSVVVQLCLITQYDNDPGSVMSHTVQHAEPTPTPILVWVGQWPEPGATSRRTLGMGRPVTRTLSQWLLLLTEPEILILAEISHTCHPQADISENGQQHSCWVQCFRASPSAC